ncbi:hypothetical protein [Ideonella sp.]|uniref:hypothetical protein n=1 Tax=Ideonella sp. TaxID=1929293 RepID=UPI0035AE930B
MASSSRRTPRYPTGQQPDLAPTTQRHRSTPAGIDLPHTDDRRRDGSARPTCPADTTEVVKRLKPGQPGTRALQRRYGPALVCVRYRRDATTGHTRFTTVELVIDHGPPRRQPLVRVTIRFDDLDTRRQAIALGAEWDDVQKTWRMPRRAAIQLGLIKNKRAG